jgi:hypothetical protein
MNAYLLLTAELAASGYVGSGSRQKRSVRLAELSREMFEEPLGETVTSSAARGLCQEFNAKEWNASVQDLTSAV